MQTLDLNLASRPFKNDTLPWVGLGLAVVALTLLTIWNVRTYRQNSVWVEDLKQQYSTTRDELNQFDQRERGAQREIQDFDLEALHVRADKANEVILWKAFSWTRLFNLLQEVLPNDAQMISIRPIFRPQGMDSRHDDELAGRVPVSVEGVARSIKVFFEFERALIAHANFDRVEPEGHTLSRTGSLAFELRFLYDPGVAPPPAEPDAEDKSAAAGGEQPDPASADESAAAGGERPDPASTDESAGSQGAETGVAENRAGAVNPEPSRQALPSDVAAGAGTDPVEAEPELAADSPAADPVATGVTTPAPGAEADGTRPKPPGARRRGKRRQTGDEQGGGQ